MQLIIIVFMCMTLIAFTNFTHFVCFDFVLSETWPNNYKISWYLFWNSARLLSTHMWVNPTQPHNF